MRDGGARASRIAAPLLAIWLTLSGRARADQPTPTVPDDRRAGYSPYEKATIDAALLKTGGSIEASPEGKRLEAIDIISLDVFEPRDPLPKFATPIANFFHATTRRYVIAREVLLQVGEPYLQAIVDETARNLRGLPQLSLVLCIPLRGSAPDRVRLLVVTKDVWSLRLNSNFRFQGGRLEYLLLQPSEENLGGTHQAVQGNFVLDPATVALGGQYSIPRIDGSRVRAVVSANVILNRETSRPEGSYGSFSYAQPLFSTRAEWSWGGRISWDYEITRRFVGGQFTQFDPKTKTCVPVAEGTRSPGNADDPSGGDPKRCQYRSDILGGEYSVTRSFGALYKHNVTFGVLASRRVFRTFPLTAFNEQQQAQFAQAVVPVTDTKIGPYIEYRDYLSRYLSLLDMEILGLQESPKVGHDVSIRILPVSTAFNSSRNLVQITASAAYTVPLGDGLVRAAVSSDTEITKDDLPNASLTAHLRIVTPRFKIGRLVFDTLVVDRYRNYLNTKSFLGGDSRLRGYPSLMFAGNNLLAANLEYRSRPLELFAVQLAGAAFFDTADAFDRFDKMLLKHSVGVGIRAGFPQLQRSVMRIDWGFPLTLTPGVAPTRSFPGDVVVTFDQAFPY